MKRVRILAATLCAVVLLCGFAVPAYAGGGDEEEKPPDRVREPPHPSRSREREER